MMKIVNVDDYERWCYAMAKGENETTTLSRAILDYIASGSGDEVTLRANRQAFFRYALRPRVFMGNSRCLDATNAWMTPRRNPQQLAVDLSVAVLPRFSGHRIALPVYVTPAGVHGLVSPPTEAAASFTGESATARACVRANTLMCVSQHSTQTLEQVAAAFADAKQQDAQTLSLLFYQLYILQDRRKTLQLLDRALAQYQGIIVTVDSIVFGTREADIRHNFNALPPPHRLVNYDDDVHHAPASKQFLPGTSAQAAAAKRVNSEDGWDQNSELMFDQHVTWHDIAWLKRYIDQKTAGRVPLIVKGIMTREDAVLALDVGHVDAIIVSNHGGRQLDSCLGALDALPEVVQAVQGRVPIYLDGGIRRGTDVIKALALGATAVGIGKPIFFALACQGQAGVENIFRILQSELVAAMKLCGCQSIERDVIGNRNLVTLFPTNHQSPWSQSWATTTTLSSGNAKSLGNGQIAKPASRL
jgi:isopentenyl diphosphate isomerase/L-lactate dehydrogenase-like FMN-dependent dehydrogenase